MPASQRDCLEKSPLVPPDPTKLVVPPAGRSQDHCRRPTYPGAAQRCRAPTIAAFIAETPIDVINAPRTIILRQTWSSAEQEVLRVFLLRRGIDPRPNTMNNLCEALYDLTATGGQYLQILNTHYLVFFQEEETHIRSQIQMARLKAYERVRVLALPDLLKELSNGVHFEQAETTREVVLIPSYGSSPLVFYSRLPDNQYWGDAAPLLVLFRAWLPHARPGPRRNPAGRAG